MMFIVFFFIGLGLGLLALIGAGMDYQQWRIYYSFSMPIGMMIGFFLLAKFRDRRLPLSLGFLLGMIITIWQALK